MVNGDPLHTIYFLLALVPVLMLVLSAGIAWGVTTATVKSIRSSIDSLDLGSAELKQEFSKWKINRNNSVVTFPSCAELRRDCANTQNARLDKFINQFERYVDKSDKRWEELLYAVNKSHGG